MRHRFAALFLVILLVATTITDTVSALAVNDDFYDENFYSLNNIGWYDPRCGDTTSAKYVQLAGNDNTERILNFFMRKGLSLAQSAGIVGNMQQESGLNPAIIQGGRIADDSYVLVAGVGFGLVQWTSPGRQQNFMKFMKDLGVGYTDLSGQLEFAWKEMNEGYPGMLRALRSTNDPIVAAVIVHGKSTVGSSHEKYQAGIKALGSASGYESSGDTGDTVVKVRGGTAQAVHDKYYDAEALAGSTAEDKMTPAGEGSESEINTMAAATNSKKKDCISKSSAGGASEEFGKLLLDYAWPTYTAGRTDQQPAYTAAVKKANSEGRYIGGAGGNDCGGFVTTLVVDSGHDKNYNSKKDGAYGNTVTQQAWLSKHWVALSDEDQKKADKREVGDVAINPDHTYIYVGKSGGPEFKSSIASASYSDRAPMAGSEAVVDASFTWYRKK